MVKIEDMVVFFILEEWGCQNLVWRNFSRDYRQENYGSIFFQGGENRNENEELILKVEIIEDLVLCGEIVGRFQKEFGEKCDQEGKIGERQQKIFEEKIGKEKRDLGLVIGKDKKIILGERGLREKGKGLGRSFSLSFNFIIFEEVFIGVKFYRCDECGKCFM